jgi:hypothetical protein
MKRVLLAAAMAGLTNALIAGSPPEEKTQSGFDRLKSLVGTWEGKDSKGGKVEVSYRVVSGGSTVMETLNLPGHAENMITMYHADGDALMMTHYCSMGNQPRMKATVPDPNTVDFSFVDGTNMGADDAHMHHLTIRFKDKNHVSEEWTARVKGEDQPHTVFALTRRK